MFNISEVAKFGAAEQAAYQQSLKYLRDMKNVVDTAHREGREEGKEENAIETARKMKKDGMSTALIAKYTALTEQEIKALIN